jgi:hypothetical protein
VLPLDSTQWGKNICLFVAPLYLYVWFNVQNYNTTEQGNSICNNVVFKFEMLDGESFFESDKFTLKYECN